MRHRGLMVGRGRAVLISLTSIVVVGCAGADDGEPLNLPIPPPLETVAPETTVLGDGEVDVDGDELAGTDELVADVSPEAETAGSVTDEAASGADASCLLGSWRITSEELNSYYGALAANTDSGAGAVDLGVIGDVALELDGENYVYTADFDLTIAVAGLEGTGVSTGTVTGTYSADGGVITTELASSDLEVTIDVGGVVMNGADLVNGLLTDVPINNAPFRCDGPTLSFQAGPDPSIRHDVTLTSG